MSATLYRQLTKIAGKDMVSDFHRNEPTRVSNTGYDSQAPFQTAIDWLDITFRTVADMTDLYAIIEELEALTTSQIDFSPTKPVFNGKMFDGSGHGTTGLRLWFTAGDPFDAFAPIPMQLKFAMSGSVIAATDQNQLAQWLISRMAKNDVDCTRLDICLDDRDKFVNLDDVLSAHYAKNFFNASYSGQQDGGKRGDALGRTIYFGHASSHRRLRVYDKFVESGGKILGNRWEVEFRKKLAREVLYEWLEKIDDGAECVVRWCRNIIVGAIDFRSRNSDDTDRSRCPHLDWFARFIAKLSASAIVIKAAVAAPTMQKSIDWVAASVAPTLFSLKSVLAEDFPKFFNELLDDGADRLSNLRRKIIKDADKGKLIY